MKCIFWQISRKIPGFISGILFVFHNPEIPGIKHRQSWDSGFRKWSGIRDPGIGIPKYVVLYLTNWFFAEFGKWTVSKHEQLVVKPETFLIKLHYLINVCVQIKVLNLLSTAFHSQVQRQVSKEIEYLNKASTAWDFSPDLGILGINLGFWEFFKQSWDFLWEQEI